MIDGPFGNISPNEGGDERMSAIADAHEAMLIEGAADEGPQSGMQRLRHIVAERSDESQLLLRNWLEAGDAEEEKA